MTRIILVYDITDNGIRSTIDKVASGYLYRVQKSVFEGLISMRDFHELTDRIREINFGTNDNVRIYKSCQRCSDDMVLIGDATKIEALPYIFI